MPELSTINATSPVDQNAGSGQVRTRRYDPDRKQRLIDATLEVITEHGAASTTHRKVAQAARVPLGSLTYHFKDLEELLSAAFAVLTDEMSKHLESALASADGKDQAREAVAHLISGPQGEPRPNFLWCCELNAVVAHHPAMRPLRDNWMTRNRLALEQHFDSNTSLMLLALIEGLTAHGVLGHISGQDVREAVNRITATE